MVPNQRSSRRLYRNGGRSSHADRKFLFQPAFAISCPHSQRMCARRYQVVILERFRPQDVGRFLVAIDATAVHPELDRLPVHTLHPDAKSFIRLVGSFPVGRRQVDPFAVAALLLRFPFLPSSQGFQGAGQRDISPRVRTTHRCITLVDEYSFRARFVTVEQPLKPEPR